MSTIPTNPNILTTSLAEIRSFNPCSEGWRNILAAHAHETNADYQAQFPLVDCLESNSIADVCWLIGRRQKEIQICVRFARMCADSVKDLNTYSLEYDAAAIAAANAAYAATAAAYAAYAANAATNAATAATAAAYAAYAAADAAAAAYNKQKELNKQFLIQCINEFNPE